LKKKGRFPTVVEKSRFKADRRDAPADSFRHGAFKEGEL